MEKHSRGKIQEITERTLAHYDHNHLSFWEGTREHDVAQNIDALLQAIETSPPFQILDFGCGPGRDLIEFQKRGHLPTGLDGSSEFIQMARAQTQANLLHQNFLSLDLPELHFDGIFANASLFHIPCQELPRVLGELHQALKQRGVLFSSNPRGLNEEGWNGERYGTYHDWKQWKKFMSDAGFEELNHFYRPAGKPRDQQPWLASVWRKP